MKQVTITLYKFNELEPQVRDEVYEREFDILLKDGWWIDDAYERFDEIMKEKYDFTVDSHEFDLDYKLSCIDGYFGSSESELAALEEVNVNHGYDLNNLSDDDYIELKDEFEEYIDRIFLDFMQNEYDCLTSEEFVKEYLEINEYDFLENGEMYIA